MDRDQWKHVLRLYDEFEHLGSAKRAEFLAKLGRENAELRTRLESLLASLESQQDFLTKPALDDEHWVIDGDRDDVATQIAGGAVDDLLGAAVNEVEQESEVQMPANLGHYAIEGRIGRGGMGVVYRAQDRNLDRTIALKALSSAFAGDDARLEALKHEARLQATLNHPNIASVFSLEQIDGHRFFTMELVERQLPCERNDRSIDEALQLARQIARALEAAHRRGIVHGDLKPGNIRLTEEGDVKVLDFSLARALSEDPAPGATPIRGTPGYMSPEQLCGRTVDQRTDVWALGCVLYELIAGRSPFLRPTVAETMRATLEEGPDWNALPHETPARVRKLLEACLLKRAEDRALTMTEVRWELEEEIAQRKMALDVEKGEEVQRVDNLPAQQTDSSAADRNCAR